MPSEITWLLKSLESKTIFANRYAFAMAAGQGTVGVRSASCPYFSPENLRVVGLHDIGQKLALGCGRK